MVWTETDSWYIKERFDALTSEGATTYEAVKTIAGELSRTPSAVYSRLHRMGVCGNAPKKCHTAVSPTVAALLKPMLERAKEVELVITPDGKLTTLRVKAE